MSRYEFIRAEKASYPVTVLCAVLGVVRSAYYAWLKRRPTKRDKRNQVLTVRVRAAHQRSGRRYGSPRVHERLARDGVRVSRKKVAAIMQENSLIARTKRRFRCSTDSRGTESIAPNLLSRNFTASAPNQVWVTDVTQLPMRTGSVFLAAILDLFSRRVVAWALSEANDTALARSALDRALATRKPPRGLVHHSDRGSPYGSKDYVNALDAAGIRRSMSRTGDCWDNAVAESFFSTLEYECIQGRILRDFSHAHHEVAEYIDAFCNPERLHSTIGYTSPIEHELAFASRPEAA